MRPLLPLAAGTLLLSSVSIAAAADPVMLAETGAYLLGNAQRCGVPSERVLRAGRIIRDMIASLSAEPSEKEVAGARFARTFLSTVHPSPDAGSLVPACEVVVTHFRTAGTASPGGRFHRLSELQP
jgi:hypothetical protein